MTVPQPPQPQPVTRVTYPRRMPTGGTVFHRPEPEDPRCPVCDVQHLLQDDKGTAYGLLEPLDDEGEA